jgi:hypothetical protein
MDMISTVGSRLRDACGLQPRPAPHAKSITGRSTSWITSSELLAAIVILPVNGYEHD